MGFISFDIFNNFASQAGLHQLLWALLPSQPRWQQKRVSHNTGNFTPYSFLIVCGFFKLTSHVDFFFKHGGYCQTGPTVYSPYQRRLESLTICWCNYKRSTFSSVILRPWVLVRPESNSRPPAWQPDAQPTETCDVIRKTLLSHLQQKNWCNHCSWRPQNCLPYIWMFYRH